MNNNNYYGAVDCPLEGCDGKETVILNIPKNEIGWDTIMRCKKCNKRWTVGQMVGMDIPIPDKPN